MRPYVIVDGQAGRFFSIKFVALLFLISGTRGPTLGRVYNWVYAYFIHLISSFFCCLEAPRATPTPPGRRISWSMTFLIPKPTWLSWSVKPWNFDPLNPCEVEHILVPETTNFLMDVWWFPTIFYVMILNYPIETTIANWLFGVLGIYFVFCSPHFLVLVSDWLSSLRLYLLHPAKTDVAAIEGVLLKVPGEDMVHLKTAPWKIGDSTALDRNYHVWGSTC